MKTPEEIATLVKAAFSGVSGQFRPGAFFDDRLDCIRVLARDCSVLETRIHPSLTVLEDNYFEEANRQRYVGFTIKGARHFCSENGFDLNSPIEVSALLDALLKAFPEVAVEIAVNAIARPLVKDENIKQVEIPEFPISMLQSASI
jgi:hypothetical protein